jgi:hypothetical protein
LAGVISCSGAASVAVKRAFCMLGRATASGFSVAANALASPISPQWATLGTARRVVSRSCALGSNGERAALCRSSREVCMSKRTSISWGCLRTTMPCESRGRVTLENTDQISIVPIYGGNAEIDLRDLADGRFAEKIAFPARLCHPPRSAKHGLARMPRADLVGRRDCAESAAIGVSVQAEPIAQPTNRLRRRSFMRGCVRCHIPGWSGAYFG